MSRYIQHSFFGLLALLVLLTVSCTEDVESTLYPTTPAINLVDLSSTDLAEFSDTLFVRFRYEDGDGDLGGLEGSSRLYVLDQRLSEPDIFTLETLTPNGEALSIAGEMNVQTRKFSRRNFRR